MRFPVLILLIVIAGATARVFAHRQRVSAPRRFPTASVRWWFPPLPEPSEFASTRARQLEVAGRVCINVAAVLMFMELIARRVP